MIKFLLALLGFGWEAVDDDGIFVRQRNKYSGEMRNVVPASRIRKLRPWHKPNKYPPPPARSDEAAAEIERMQADRDQCKELARLSEQDNDRLRAALKVCTSTSSSTSTICWWSRRTVGFLPALRPPCKRCGGKGSYIVEITNHGERNEFFQEVCKDCGGATADG